MDLSDDNDWRCVSLAVLVSVRARHESHLEKSKRQREPYHALPDEYERGVRLREALLKHVDDFKRGIVHDFLSGHGDACFLAASTAAQMRTQPAAVAQPCVFDPSLPATFDVRLAQPDGREASFAVSDVWFPLVQASRLLKEVWRVLAGGGRLLIVVPNRRGIWARLDRTPFGSGRPYTMSQLSQLLRDELFTPVATGSALFVPPSRSRMAPG